MSGKTLIEELRDKVPLLEKQTDAQLQALIMYFPVLDRYTPAELQVVEKYLDGLCRTRKSGKISDKIIVKQLEYFLKYDKTVVLKALKLHMEKYPMMKEDYTRGIIRNLAREVESGGYSQYDRGSKGEAEGLAGRDRAAADAIASRLGV